MTTTTSTTSTKFSGYGFLSGSDDIAECKASMVDFINTFFPKDTTTRTTTTRKASTSAKPAAKAPDTMAGVKKTATTSTKTSTKKATTKKAPAKKATEENNQNHAAMWYDQHRKCYYLSNLYTGDCAIGTKTQLRQYAREMGWVIVR